MKLDKGGLTTSKKILYMSYFFLFAVTIVFVVMLVSHNEFAGELGAVVVAALAETGIHTAVYSSKSKKENALYIAYDMIDKLADKYGIENVVTLYDSVNRE